ncbi:MAG: hypothetical protein ABL999_17590 [Pyrinomonadaceae bacterium]
MLDENGADALQEILEQTRGALNQAVAKLRDAEGEVERLKSALSALEGIAAHRPVDGVRTPMNAGRAGSLGNTFHIEEVPSQGSEEMRSNVQDLNTRDYRPRDSSVAYLNQNRPKLVQQDFEPSSDRFSDRTITQSCTMLLKEAGRPLHVNELYNLLIAGGMKFKGNNPTISVAVSLSRNSRFRKVDPGTFDLIFREAYQAAS